MHDFQQRDGADEVVLGLQKCGNGLEGDSGDDLQERGRYAAGHARPADFLPDGLASQGRRDGPQADALQGDRVLEE